MDYKVSFFKIGYEKDLDEKGKPVKSGKDEMLGSVVVDDECATDRLTIQALAFRRAPDKCLMADLVIVQKV